MKKVLKKESYKANIIINSKKEIITGIIFNSILFGIIISIFATKGLLYFNDLMDNTLLVKSTKFMDLFIVVCPVIVIVLLCYSITTYITIKSTIYDKESKKNEKRKH